MIIPYLEPSNLKADRNQIAFLSERNHIALQTLFVHRFTENGGMSTLLTSIEKAVNFFCGHILTFGDTGDEGKKELVKQTEHVQNSLDVAFHLLRHLASWKLLNESPHTATLTSKSKDKDESDVFDPQKHLVSIRANVLPIVYETWKSPCLRHLKTSTVKSILHIFVQVLKREGEVSIGKDASSPNIETGLRSSSSFVPDKGLEEQLVDMGFTREAATAALTRSSNNLSRATELLLNNPDFGPLVAKIPAESSTQLSSQDPTKDKHLESVNSYSALIEKVKLGIIDESLAILHEMEELVFDVRDLFTYFCKEKNGAVLHQLIDSIEGIKCHDTEPSSSVFLRLLALLLNDVSIHKFLDDVGSRCVKLLVSSIHTFASSNATLHHNRLTSCLLSLEAFISLADEPQAVNQLEQDGTPENPNDQVKYQLTMEVRQQLIQDLAISLKHEKLSDDLLNALMRLLVRLTRKHSLAVHFADLGGIPYLLESTKSRGRSFAGQKPLLVIILRHIIEDYDTLKYSMERGIIRWFTLPRARFVDVNNYLRSTSQISCRDGEVFIEATQNVCQLSNFDKSSRIQQISLKKPTDTQDQSQKEDKVAVKDHNLSRKCTSVVMDYLIGELHSLSSSTIPDVFESASAASQNSKNITQQESGDVDNGTSPIHFKTLYRCFILQILSELVLCFPSCKQFMMHYHIKTKKKPFNIASHLLNDLIPYDGILTTRDVNDTEQKRRLVTSDWAMSVFVSLCSIQDEDMKSVQGDISNTQKWVLENIAKAFKEHQPKSLDLRYGKLHALSILLHKILTGNNPKPVTVKSDSISSVVKFALEKEFILLLTNALGDVDLNFPHSQILVGDIVKPLEHLSNMAVKQSRTDTVVVEKEVDNHAYQPSEVPESDRENEMAEVYRTSSLGIFNAQNVDEENEEISGTSEEEDFGEEDEFDESSGSEMGSEESDAEDDVDMEIVIQPSFQDGDETHSDGAEDDGIDDSDEDEDDAEEGFDSDEENVWEEGYEDISDDEGSAEDVSGDEIALDNGINVQGHPDVPEDMMLLDESNAQDSSNETNMPNQVAQQAEAGESSFPWNQDGDAMLDEEADDTQELNSGGSRGRRQRRQLDRHVLDIGQGSWSITSDNGPLNFDNYSYSQYPMNNTQSQAMDLAVHPFLVNRSDSANQETAIGRATRNGNELELTDWRAIHDLVGGNAVQLLEQVLAGNSRLAGQGRGTYRIVSGNSSRIPMRSRYQLSGGGRGSVDSDPFAALFQFAPLPTTERWYFEARVLYGNSVNDKSLGLLNALLNVLVPLYEAAKELKLKESKRLLEAIAEPQTQPSAAQVPSEDIVDATAVQQLPAPVESQATVSEQDSIRSTEVQQPSEPPSDVQVSSTTEQAMITVRGVPVNIANTGIDPTFLEALPDEMREEVLTQHFREVRRAARESSDSTSTVLSQDFLNSLPPQIRREIIQQESLENVTSVSQPLTGPTDMDTASFLASLDPQLRETVLLEQDEAFLASLPPSLVAESGALRTRRRLPNLFGATAPISADATSSKQVKKVIVPKDTPQLLDKPSLTTLVRLLYIPQPVEKASLHKLLLNLSENAKTRGELFNLLLSILHEGSGELGPVDKSFSQLSLKSKMKSPGNVPPGRKSSFSHSSMVTLPSQGRERIPNLIAHRSLEALTYIVTYNERSVDYFLTENDNVYIRKCYKDNKKSKSKEKVILSKFPAVTLINLLDRPAFLNNVELMDQLMHLLSIVLQPMSSLYSKSRNKKDPSAESSSADREPPIIPDVCIKSVINVLTAGDCSSKTFQYTLSVIQSVSVIPNHQDSLLSELILRAQQLGEELMGILTELNQSLDSGTASDIQNVTLSMFSPSSSKQSKLLRVLKTVDYMHIKQLSSSSRQQSAEGTTDVNGKESESNEKHPGSTVNSFGNLWQLLSQCLWSIEEKGDLVHVATVLLPTIESFMVVCKLSQAKQGLSSPISTKIMSSNLAAKNDDFLRFTEKHRKILNTMVRNNPSLMSGSFSLLVENPKVLDFDNKKNYFTQQLHKRPDRQHYGTLQINVRRQYVFEDSFHQLQGKLGNEIKYGKLSVRFYEEDGVDAGGVTREWFSVLSRQMFNPDYALFKPSAVDKVTYQPNRASYINPDHLSFFKFVGRVIGKAIYDGRLLDCYFTRSFYKHILNVPVDYRDLEAVDPEYYKSLVWILENDITDIMDLTFSIESEDFGEKKVINLLPDGENVAVTEENKQEYVKLITEHKLYTAIKQQVEATLSGFYEIIPKDLIRIFDEQELELLISGLPDIDIDDWKNNTEYTGYTPSSPQIQWFWRAVRSFNQEERAKLLQFVTGTSKVPLEGFSSIEGVNGVQKFQIHKDFQSVARLPSAHTW
jgi:E3 ubiquitin-protein ligase HUWE1